jgi:hypothetical protein
MEKFNMAKKMVFVVFSNGDRDVGLDGIYEEISLPNPGYPEEDWIEQCHSVIKELYLSEFNGTIMIKEEYDADMKLLEEEANETNNSTDDSIFKCPS